ncbi:hypothetical protein IM40_01895 [Candidatus Paracaedimonas acanthamoebae]|nr:hypothetical protein IM40_01895 [Candidatus Paracaedimonas acanthamoebae]
MFLISLFTKLTSLLDPQRDSSKVVLSICLMILWALSFTVAMSFAKIVRGEIPSLMILFLRCFFGFLFFSPFVIKEGISGLRTRRPFLHGIRVILTCTAMFCTYYAYRHLPLATASAIGFTSPLFTTIFSFLFFKEKISYKKWMTIFAGYLGVLIILRPFSLHFDKAMYVALLANAVASGSIIAAKRLSSTESTITILFYTNVATFLLSSFSVIWVWQAPEMREILILACVGLAGILSQFFYIKALKLGKPSFLSPFEYTRLLFAILVGSLFFHETLDLWSLMGALVIILATFFLSRMEINSQK